MEAATNPAQQEPRPLNVLVWHVHGSWMTSFVHGGHNYLLPTDAAEPEWALGRCGRPWPDTAREVAPGDLADEQVDVVVLQRPHELELTRQWLRRTPGVDIPAVYVEHNAPREHAALSQHPVSDRTDITLVHVTHFNQLMWDNGRAPVTVIPHGILDPGHLYSGELARAATIINEPVRRWRITGTDLLVPLSEAAPFDVYGIGTDNLHRSLLLPPERVHGAGDHPQQRLHAELARRRLFVHTPRWTSLGLSVLEAMYLGMPIVAVATTEAPVSIPAEAGVVSTEIDVLAEGIRQFVHEPFFAELAGKAARHWALTNYGIDEFIRRWDRLLTDKVAAHPGNP
ncbi:glycosyltransferase [Nocardia donostiensis]|uniref:Glycosyl transferase n=1 Tax=Nocardia donostiensis TaxID=1538463 RepID=A0A1W0B6T7_9NOCA|nr:glycosyltransferase [Nocardia donostiensis]ONM48781.1 glycosyl transferase [Nocardia donostiensis]OQS13021.1 glycosyl transferase [Nocardia donostiensis]OQS18199.1 glycosyl transferase [Nocardia donostiensis]